MSNRINGAELKKIFEKATDEGSVEDGTYGYRKLNKLKLYVYHLKDMIEYIDFRTRFIKKQMEIIIRLNRDNRILIERNRKLKDICNNIGRRRSSSSLSTIQESQFQVKHLLNEPPQQIPNDLLEAFAKDDRENPFSIEKYEKQQKAMYERLRGKRKPKKSSSTTTTTAPKKSSGFNSSNIDYSNIIFGDQPRKRTQTQANSGSSGSSSSKRVKKKCTETYNVGDIVDVRAYGDNNYSATIDEVGPKIVTMGNKSIEIKAGQYLVIFHVDGSYEVVSARWKREGWYISKLISRKPEEKPFEGLDLNKMDIKF